MHDIELSLGYTMSITLLLLGGVAVALGHSREISVRLLRRVGWMYLTGFAALIWLYWYYHVPPPLIFVFLVGLLLAVYLVRSRNAVP